MMPLSAPLPRTKRAVVASMRNEGLWILEWVAYHRAIGFDLIFIASNDCTDGSDEMLARLDQMGEIIHLPHTPPEGVSPQEAGCALALAHPAMAEVAWLLHIDADEFLNITEGDGKIDDLLAITGHADCVNICWKMFGAGGQRVWNGGSVLETFTQGEEFLRRRIDPLGKSLFRPERFARIFSHLPKEPIGGDVRLVNTKGKDMPTDALQGGAEVRHREANKWLFTWRNAVINHYAIRSLDVFLLKNHRGDGLAMAHQKYLEGSNFWRNAEKTDLEDRSILRHWPAVAERLARYRADPTLAATEAEALTRFAALRETLLEQQGLWGWHDATPAPNATP